MHSYFNPTGYPWSSPPKTKAKPWLGAYRPRLKPRAAPYTAAMASRVARIEDLLSRQRAGGGVARAAARGARRSSRSSSPIVTVTKAARAPKQLPARAPKQIGTKKGKKGKKKGRGHPGQTYMFADNPYHLAGSKRRKRRHNPPLGESVRSLARVDTWVAVAQGLGGFTTALALPIMLAKATGMPKLNTGWGGVATSAGSAVASGLVASFLSREAGKNALSGGLIATGLRVLFVLWPSAGSYLGLSPRASSATGKGVGADNYLMEQQLGRDEAELAANYLMLEEETPTEQRRRRGGGRRRRGAAAPAAAAGGKGAADYVDVGVHGDDDDLGDDDMDDYVDVGVHGDELGDDEQEIGGDDDGVASYLTTGEPSTYSAREVIT